MVLKTKKHEDLGKMDEAFDPSKPMYRNDFDQFLNDKYGVDPNPFENEDFEW